MFNLNRICISLIISVIILGSFVSCNNQKSNQKIENLVAFSKLYGYVRYFHPSDEAANTDWDAFVVNGVEKVKNARNKEELSKILKQLFYPIAPTIQIYNSTEKPALPSIPKDTSGLVKVFWQHYGLLDNTRKNIYQSIRINRVTENSIRSFKCLTELLNNEFQNCEIKFNLKVKTEFLNKESFLELRLKGNNFQDEKSDTIFDNGTFDAEVKLKIENQTSPLQISFQFTGEGKILVDDARVFIKKGNIVKSISVPNSNFEEYFNNSEPKEWIFYGEQYNTKANTDKPISGKTSFEICSPNHNNNGAIFDYYPKENEFIDKELMSGLKCRVPLVLWCDSAKGGNGSSHFPKDSLRYNNNNLNSKIISSLDNENVRLADVIITWNVIQHFFPYFEYLKVNWDNQQKKTLEQTFKDVVKEDFIKTLKNMLEPLKDGHVNVYKNYSDNNGTLPFIVEWVEDKVVITKSAVSTFKSGDILTQVNGEPILDVIQEREKYISGSPQLKRTKCLNWGGLIEGKEGEHASITIEQDGKKINTDINLFSSLTVGNLRKDNLKPVRELKNDIYYINIGKASIEDVELNINNLKEAKGLIIDLREYPKNNLLGLFSYLTDKSIYSPSMYVPTIIYPDRNNIKFKFSNWHINPKQPFLKCKKIFIFGPGTISAGETISSIVKYNKLGITIGQPTAGVNGNINTFEIPGNVTVIFTGMKVMNADNSQHFLKGVQPDVFVNKTIKGVREGRDEFIEKAEELLMK